MQTQELTDKLYEAQDNSVVRFTKYKPYRTIEIESRPRSKQVLQIARQLADEVLKHEVHYEAGRIKQIEDEDRTHETMGTYMPFASLAERYKVA